MAKQVDPRKVTSIPEGYNKEIRDGRTVYVKKTQSVLPNTQSNVTIVKPRIKVPTSNIGTQSLTIKPKPRVSSTPPLSNSTEDVVYLDEPVANTDNQNIPLFEDKRIDRKLQTPIHPNIDYYQYPNPNAGYSQPINKYFDKTTQQEIDPAKSLSTGSYLPSYLDNTLKVNEGVNLGTEKQGNPRVTTDPTITNVMEGVSKERSGTKGVSTMGTVGFKKGGIISKIKGYYDGGDVENDNSGVIGQNDQYADKNAQVASDAKKVKAMKVANTVGQGLGGVGAAYYNSQPTTNQADAERNAALATTSQMGGVGGAIGGLAAIGDKIGKPIKQRSERLDANGNLVDPEAAKRNAVIGGLFSPSKALTTRLSYSGGLTDFSGNGYLKSIQDAAKKQLKQVNYANTASRQQQAILANDTNNENPEINNPYNLSGAAFDANKQLVLSNNQQFDPNRPQYKKGGIVGKIQMCADGGQIKGKGTGTSDSISAKVEAKSFVVPAKNAPIAEELREKFLGKPPKSKANLNQKGGEKVRLSNGEHLYTPEEKEELLEKGVNVDLLAPKSEVKAISKDYMKVPNVIMNFKEGGNVPKGTVVDGVMWNGTNWIDSSGNKYTSEKGKVFDNKYNQSLVTNKKNEETRKASELNVYKRKYNEAVQAGDTKNAEGLNRKINELQGKTQVSPNEIVPRPSSNTLIPKSTSLRVPKSNKIEQTTLTPKGSALDALKQDAELKANAATIDSEKSINNAPKRQAAINDANIANNENYVNNNPTQRRGGVMDKIGNIDPTSFIGAGQTALGLNMLGKSKRPIYKAILDPTYNAAVNRAQENAKFGLTPEQNLMAQQDIQSGLNDAKFAGLNASGVQSFNTNRAAINDAWKNKLGLNQANFEARMDKQKYADAMAADRANILSTNRRQAYNDAMGAFQQNQGAGSELIGAGLQNTIGAYRFNRLKNQEDQENAASNPWLNYKQ